MTKNMDPRGALGSDFPSLGWPVDGYWVAAELCHSLTSCDGLGPGSQVCCVTQEPGSGVQPGVSLRPTLAYWLPSLGIRTWKLEGWGGGGDS